MNIRTLPWLLLALNCGTALAQDQSGTADRPYHLRDPQRWGTLSRVVQPAYPQEALARRQAAVVDIEGVVMGSGVLADVTYKSDSPNSAAFIAALQEVVPQWLFFTPIGNDCLPDRQRVTTRVSFELPAGEPKIFTTHLKQERSRPPPAQFVVLHEMQPSYPRSMVQRGWEARVYSRLELDPAGRVVDISTTAFSRFTKQPIQLAEFEKPAEFALGSWRYAPAPPGTKGSRFACIDVDYRLKG
jgi:TonB family protein